MGYYKRGNEWKGDDQTLNAINPESAQAGSSGGLLENALNELKVKYEIRLEWNKTESPGNTYKANPNNDEIRVTAVPDSNPPATFKGFKHQIPSNTDRVNRITIHGQVTNGINNADFEQIEFQSTGGVFVYYSKENDPNLQRPYLICLSKNGRADADPDNKWYKRTGNTAWGNATEFGASDDPNSITALDNKLNGIKTGLNSDTGYTSSSNDIDASVTPTQQGVGKEALYGAGPNQIKVERTEGGTTVPAGYVRYKHEINKSGDNPFTLGLVKHNDHELKNIVPTGGTPNVKAVYVYYRQSKDDPNHEFPLIVCVKMTGSTPQRYYKRGNKWTQVTDITSGPEDTGVKDQLNRHLPTLIQEYEVKLEQSNGDYKARPQPAGSNPNITVSPLQKSGDYNGYKHLIPGASGGKINYISIYNQPIKGVTEVENGRVFTTTQNGGGLYVYYVDIKKPLLICLSPTGTRGSTNIWYKRRPDKIWEDANSTFGSTNPDTIDAEFEKKLRGIKIALESPPGTQDTGYTPLDYILKLDYVAKDTTNGITYVTGNDPEPSNRVITVTKTEGSNSADSKVPEGYVRYKHEPNTPITGTITYKHNGFDLNGIPTNTADVKAVYVYYEKTHDSEHQFPLIVCVKKSGTERTYYKRGNEWKGDDQELNKVDPDDQNTGQSGGTLERELNRLKNIHEINIGYTTVGTPYKANAEGSEITVTKQAGGSTGPVPSGYVAYKHSKSTAGSINVKFKHFGNEFRGLPDKNVDITSNNQLWVYYQLENGNPVIEKPLLIYVKVGSDDKWYRRGLE